MDKFHVRIAHCGVTHFLKSLFTLNLPFKKRSSLNLFLKIWIQYFYIELVFTKNRFSIIDMSFHCGVTHFWKYEFSIFTLNLSFFKNSFLNLFLKIWIRYFYIELVFTKNGFSMINMSFHCGVTHFWKYEFSLFTLNLSFKKRSLLNWFFFLNLKSVFLYWTCLYKRQV